MVNKRFNKKFRRALGAALGALSVASISNIETITHAYTETDIENNALINWIFQMPRGNLNRLWTYTAECKNNEIQFVPASGILDKGVVGAFVGNVKVSYPYHLGKIGDWEGYNVTIHIANHEPIRISILKATNVGGNDLYLSAPPLKKGMFRDYATTHTLPQPYSWTKKNGGPSPQRFVRPNPPPLGFQANQCLRYQTSQLNIIHGDVLEQQANQTKDAHGHPLAGYNINRGCFVSPANFVPKFRKYFEGRWDPTQPRPVLPVADIIEVKNSAYLTRWHCDLLTDASLWDDSLKIIGGPNAMKMRIDEVPAELKNFYYPPEEKKEDTTLYSTSSNTPNQPVSSNMTTLTPAMTAMLAAPAVAMATNQPAPTPAHVVANNNVTQGSNNAGAAPSAQNGSVSSGSADVGPTSQTGSDVKPTSVQHDAKSKSDSNEPLKT